MKEPSPPHTLPGQQSNTTNLLNRNFPGVTAMNLVSHFHVVNTCCHGACFFSPTCKCSVRLCRRCPAQQHQVQGGAIHIISLCIYYEKCLSEGSKASSNKTSILQQFSNRWQGCLLIIHMKVLSRIEVALSS